jgi:hypothetical protein
VHLYNYSVKGAIVGGLLGGAGGAVLGGLDFETVAKQVEDRGYLPKQNYEGRKRLLATPEGAIAYIAAIMAAIAEIAARMGFEDIRRNPVILTNAYQSQTLTTWEEHLRNKKKGTPLAGGNTMDVWVGCHLPFLEDAVGRPDTPREPDSAAAPDDGEKSIVVKKGDTLSGLAEAEYGTWELWPLIFDRNEEKIGPDPNLIRPGLRLSVLPLARYTAVQIGEAKRRAPSWKKYR